MTERLCPRCASFGEVAYHSALFCPRFPKPGETVAIVPVSQAIGKWERILDEAGQIAPGRLGSLLWVDSRCQLAGMHALDPQWVRMFSAYYDSGKLVMMCRKGLRAGGSVSACRSLVRAALFAQRDLDGGTIGVVPIMSSSRDEATDRFHTIKRILAACGMSPKKADDEDVGVVPGGIGTTYESARSQAGGGIIRCEDSQGHKIEFRVLPAMRRASVGFTGIAGFLDESDLWPDDPEHHVNPATAIFSEIVKRFTTQMATAELFIFSASYFARSAHSARIDMGDSASQFVARLGEEGAAKDETARRLLAEATGSNDPRLSAAADSKSPDIPAWVSAEPCSPILTCWTLSEEPGLTHEEQLGRMLGKYGGRAAENAVRDAGPTGETLAGVSIQRVARPERGTLLEVVIGIAPAVDGSLWGIIVIGAQASGPAVVLLDASALMLGGEAAAEVCEIVAMWSAPFAAVASAHHDRVRQELDAYVSGTGRYAPALAKVDLYDGGVLRVGPLRTLYEHGRLAHAPGLGALEGEAEAWTAEAPRNARLEALAAAAGHLRSTGRLRLDGGAYDPGGTPRALGAMLERATMGNDTRETFDPGLLRRGRGGDWI